MKAPRACKFHDDLSVTYWRVSTSAWERIGVHAIAKSDGVMASLRRSDRDQIDLLVGANPNDCIFQGGGGVIYWHVDTRTWEISDVLTLSLDARILASLPESDRARITKDAAAQAARTQS